jgi:hypothetical protein
VELSWWGSDTWLAVNHMMISWGSRRRLFLSSDTACTAARCGSFHAYHCHVSVGARAALTVPALPTSWTTASNPHHGEDQCISPIAWLLIELPVIHAFSNSQHCSKIRDIQVLTFQHVHCIVQVHFVARDVRPERQRAHPDFLQCRRKGG